MNKRLKGYIWLGKLYSYISKIADFDYNGTVYMTGAVVKHVLKKHKSQLNRKILNDINGCIKMVIKNPDYVGVHPDKLGKSIELVKYIHGHNILVAIDIDEKDRYMYVSSMYPITDAKLESRIYSGRFKKIPIKEVAEK